ncbi:hypothetical protein Hanom_Chr17g01581701 [Helianthus anomalus]
MLSKLSRFFFLYAIVSCIVYQTQHLCIFKSNIVDSLFSETVVTHIRVLGVLYIYKS